MRNTNATPFVSTPLSSEIESMQIMSTFSSPGSTIRPTLSSAQMDDLDNLYPEIYREIYPLVADAVDKIIAGGYRLTPDAISATVDNIIKNSGLWHEDEDGERFGMNPEVVPVQFGFGGAPFRRPRCRHHNCDTLRDITRILLLRELFGRHGGFSRRIY